MPLKKIHTVVAVFGIVLAGGAAWWWQNPSTRGMSTAGAPGVTGAPAPGAARGPGGGGGPSGPGGPGGLGGPPAVEVGKVQVATLVDDVQALGSLRSRQSVVVRPEVSGRIATLGFRDGQRVRRGQLLVQFDDTFQQAQLKQAQAQAGIARTNLQRSRELLAQNFISQSAVDQNAAALEVADAQVALAQAQLARLRIVAPFDAMAGIRQANIGDYLKDGAEIVNLEDVSSLLVDFRLPERYLARLRSGLEVEVDLDALPGKVFKGRIEALDAQVDANGRSLLVRARVENPDAQLKPGMFARSRVVFGVREQALVVPEEALVPLGDKQFLYRVSAGEGGQKVARRLEARIGLRLPGRVEVLDGLQAGDLVVTAGQGRLRAETTSVRVVDLDAPRADRGPGAAPGGASGARPAASAVNGAAAARAP